MVAHVERWAMTGHTTKLQRAFWWWRNPFVKLIMLIAFSAIGGIALATHELPFWVRFPIYILWSVTAILTLICAAAVLLEERARKKRRKVSEDKS